MNNPSLNNQQQDYLLVEKAIEYIEQNALEQPTLKAIADYTGLSESHFQKLFSRWAGISPKRFLQYLTKEHVMSVLKDSQMEDAVFQSGLSTKSRVYDLMVSCEAMSPGEYKRLGKDLTIEYGFHDTPFGICLIATTPRGICKIGFSDSEEQLRAELETDWYLANLIQNQESTEQLIKPIFQLANKQAPLHLVLKGTNFQLKVWEALIKIPHGSLATYQDIADSIENPKGVRAVGSAIGSNPIAFLIPCHRVIRKNCDINQYRWGTARKHAIIGWEQATRNKKAR